MKIKLLISLVIIQFTVIKSVNAQEINSVTFLKEFNELFSDAQDGFPKSKGSLLEDIGWFGRKYAANKYFFNNSAMAALQYIKPHEPTKYVPKATPEQFYFTQTFIVERNEGKFANDSLEIVLDLIAKGGGYYKKNIKQEKEYRKTYKSIEYQKSNKPIYSLLKNLKSNTYSITIYSPVRPSDVAKPKNRLGFIVFKYTGFSYVYAVTVYGEKLSNVNSIVEKAFKATGLVDRYNTYFWHPKKSVDQLSIELGNSVIVRDAGSIDVD